MDHRGHQGQAPQHQHHNQHNGRHSSAQDVVTSHYNARPNTRVEDRVKSPIYYLRNFNNWIKSVIIADYTPSRAVVLDLCAGKGGDLPKWCKARIQYWVAADIAEESVKAAEERYRNSRHAAFPALFLSTDCFQARASSSSSSSHVSGGVAWLACVAGCTQTRLSDHLDRDLWFDLVNCQFALHYAFDSEQRVLSMLQNVSDRLKDGGWFIGTIPNANWIVKKIRHCEGNTFGNSVYSITFPQKRTFPEFGAQYTFSLIDAVKDVPEYLVHFPTLERLAAKVGLQLYKKWTFHELFCEKVKTDQALYRLLFHMEAVDENGAISADEWEAANIYLAFAFRKVGETRSYPPLTDPETGMRVIPPPTQQPAAPPPDPAAAEDDNDDEDDGYEDGRT